MWQPAGRRTSIEIIADVLRFLRLGETGSTEIMYTAKLSRDQTSKYLNWLLETDLLEDVEKEIGVPCYRITKKGLTLLSKIENMQEMLPPEDGLNILHRSKFMKIVVPENRIVKSSEVDEV